MDRDRAGDAGQQCQESIANTARTYCMTLNTAVHLYHASVSPFSLHIYPVGTVVPVLWLESSIRNWEELEKQKMANISPVMRTPGLPRLFRVICHPTITKRVFLL